MEKIVNNIKTNYIIEGIGENILLLHGWGASIKLFKQMIAELSKSYCVIALDMPGFGKTDEPSTPWCVDDYVNFVLAFLKELNITKTILLGHSFGGRVIIKMVTRSITSITFPKLILIDSAGIIPVKTPKQRFNQGIYKIGKSVLQFAPIKSIFPNALDNYRSKHGSADYKAASPIMRSCLVKVVNEDLAPFLPKIVQPTLLIWGENDTATPLSDGRKMEELIPDAGLVSIKNATHYSFLEQWFTVNRVLHSFLNIKE